ncbi:hypothetical protein BLA18112_05370 [Burkholderia lata]|uniref:mannan endo-1,4-beta-mannosidase n=1 Tax=Burkholderia lata (strain ATCC 17760 / DSM 23089 / LMG 22485 / NCIMB 9086 / R18194 / 383) TaxID=482957 RepID=A0A6P2YKX9_BURL3|nr:hypothetical protein [Burkholderia lata]VWD21258.1 hypothetical protein BLA18112_05370 [Burkholderia lata]
MKTSYSGSVAHRWTRKAGRVGIGACIVLLASCGGGVSSDSPADEIAGTAAQRSNVPGLTPAQYANAFVTRQGSKLMVAGKPFRFSGTNVEYLGLRNYGPAPSVSIPVGSARYPTQYEVDDALATAHEMGATVIRAQTLGDTIGCPQCIEPSLGVFNDAAFAQMDMVVVEARKFGIKLIGEFDGDANGTGAGNQSHNWYCTWRGIVDCTTAFFNDPDVIGDYKRHMQAVLTHVNPLTGLAYKDDPTFLGWVDGNAIDSGFSATSNAASNSPLPGLAAAVPDQQFTAWLSEVSSYFKSIDGKQLFIDISFNALAPSSSAMLTVPGLDIVGEEWYPHWLPLYNEKATGNSPGIHASAAQTVAAGKAYALLEYGWDNTDYQTTTALQTFLDGVVADANIAGDDFWALQSHASGQGWLPIPANEGCQPSCEANEDGNWWALYYTGLATLSNTAADMAQRAQMLRTHGYAMNGMATSPAHEQVGAPAITSTSGGKIVFQGAAGSPTYSVQTRQADGTWATPCQNCTTDAAGGWVDAAAQASSCYRVVGVNLDGIAGAPSTPAGPGCQASAAGSQRQAASGA